MIATLTSVPLSVERITDDDLGELLEALRWAAADLDTTFPPRIAYAGAHHPILAASTRRRLDDLDYDFTRLKRLTDLRRWATVQLIWQSGLAEFLSRNPFPSGGVVEDPATGAAAAALGAYLRELRLLDTPGSITVHQGVAMGRPSVIEVDIPPGGATGIHVSGAAVELVG